MTKIFLVAILIMLSFQTRSFSQEKIKKFCQVIIQPKNSLTSEANRAGIIFGNVDSLSLSDSAELYQLKKVNTLTSTVDVLNYMSRFGWRLSAALPYNQFATGNRFYFEKEFDKK